MAKFAYDPQQTQTVNLDNVDSIVKSKSPRNEFTISFYREVGIADRSFGGTVGYWKYKTEAERDRVYNSLMKDYGKNYGS